MKYSVYQATEKDRLLGYNISYMKYTFSNSKLSRAPRMTLLRKIYADFNAPRSRRVSIELLKWIFSDINPQCIIRHRFNQFRRCD